MREENDNIEFILYSERPEVIIEREREARNKSFAEKMMREHSETFEKLKENDEEIAHNTPDNTPDTIKRKYMMNRRKNKKK